MMMLDNIISDLGAEEHKILMEKLQKDESCEWKIVEGWIMWMSFFFEFSLIIYIKILDNMFETIY